MTQDTITRKDIADAARVSLKTVGRREIAWGLDKCRCWAVEVPAIYYRAKANTELLRRSIIEKPI